MYYTISFAKNAEHRYSVLISINIIDYLFTGEFSAHRILWSTRLTEKYELFYVFT